MTRNVARTAQDARLLLDRQAEHEESLVVYFNSDCEACRQAHAVWAQEGLYDCSNVAFVEYNAATQAALTHVTHLPSYEQRSRGRAIGWTTVLPDRMRVVAYTNHSFDMVCRPRTNAGS